MFFGLLMFQPLNDCDGLLLLAVGLIPLSTVASSSELQDRKWGEVPRRGAAAAATTSSADNSPLVVSSATGADGESDGGNGAEGEGEGSFSDLVPKGRSSPCTTDASVSPKFTEQVGNGDDYEEF
jgi:hypothetical protein